MAADPGDRTFRFLTRVLLAGNVGSVVLGLALLVVPGTPVMAAYDASVARAFHGSEALPPAAAAQHLWSIGLVGAAVVGWGIVNCFLVAIPFARRERWAFWALATGMPAWMALDVTTSIIHGVWAEVVFVGVAALLLLPPLLWSGRYFRSPPT